MYKENIVGYNNSVRNELQELQKYFAGRDMSQITEDERNVLYWKLNELIEVVKYNFKCLTGLDMFEDVSEAILLPKFREAVELIQDIDSLRTTLIQSVMLAEEERVNRI